MTLNHNYGCFSTSAGIAGNGYGFAMVGFQGTNFQPTTNV